MKAGYKKTEVGLIPVDWEAKKLGDFCELISSKRIFENEYVSSGIPFYRGKEISLLIENKKIEDEYFISEERYEKIKRVFGAPLKGDILVTAVGTLGNVYLIPNDNKFYFKDGNLIWLKNIKNIDISYFAIQIRNYKNEIINNAIGSSQKALTIIVLKSQKIPLPALPEQKAIAEVLSDTDNLIQALEKRIAKKCLIKQGAMQKLLTPKDGWEVKRLGEIGTFKNGINKSGEDFGFGYPFVNLMDVFGKTTISTNERLGLINSNEVERKMYELRKGDVLFIRSSVKPEGVGLTCLIKNNLKDTVFSGFIIRYRDNGVLSNEYKEHYFYNSHFRNNLIGSSTVSANTNINQEALKNLTISFPILKSEQTRIATILSDMDTEIEALEKKLAKYKQLKQGLMQNLLTGKIRLV